MFLLTWSLMILLEQSLSILPWDGHPVNGSSLGGHFIPAFHWRQPFCAEPLRVSLCAFVALRGEHTGRGGRSRSEVVNRDS